MVIDALKIVGNKNIKFKIMGSGVLEEEFKIYAKKNNVACDFMGFLSYSKMINILYMCDVAVNPINEKSVSSIINKVSDYAAANLPVINSQNSQEYRKLLDDYNCGINTLPGDKNSMAKAISELFNNREKLKQMKLNSRQLWINKFDRKITYMEIIELIRSLCNV